MRPSLSIAPTEDAPQEVTRLCGWCQTHVSGPAYREGQPVTHGICPRCKEGMASEIARITP